MTPAPLLLGLALLAAQPPSPEWKEFAPLAGGFRVLLPGVPQQQKESFQTPFGPVEVSLFTLEPKKGAGTYVVSCSQVPDAHLKRGDPPKRLRLARDTAVARAKGTLRADRPITLQGHPGREFEIEVGGKVRLRTRMYAVKNRLYQVLVSGPSDWLHSADAKRFLGSFRVTDP